MRPLYILNVIAGAAVALVLLGGAGELDPAAPQYDASGKMLFPAGYREWVFLSSGLDMSYSDGSSDQHVFNNVFVPRASYESFLKTGVWPDKTVLLIEHRLGGGNVSIAKRGVVQTGDPVGFEAHVKDGARFKGGWAFFGFGDDKPAEAIPATASCYSCHQQHGAADTTFVQFYPTLLPVATKLGTLNPAYVAETKAGH